MNNDYSIIEIKNGLGNQIFQYAFSLNLPNVYFDVSRYTADSHRKLDLQHFNVKMNLATKAQCRNFLKPVYLPHFLRKLFHLSKYRGKWLEPQNAGYNPDFLKLTHHYISGYFNNWQYFDKFRPRLLQELVLNEPLDDSNNIMLKQIMESNAVFIHIRRSDYLTRNLPVLPKEYYDKAIEYIFNHTENPHLFIFSDDIPWCQDNLINLNNQSCTFVNLNDGLHGYIDLELMRHCKHAIIANSTFSWWGAYLINNPDKIILTPAPHYSTAESGLYFPPPVPLNNWIVIG